MVEFAVMWPDEPPLEWSNRSVFAAGFAKRCQVLQVALPELDPQQGLVNCFKRGISLSVITTKILKLMLAQPGNTSSRVRPIQVLLRRCCWRIV